MTDYLLALVPDYGLYIVTGIVFIAAMGIPLPASVIALTSGGLAATGDFALSEVLLATLAAYVVGDQCAYTLGRLAKPQWLARFRASRRIGPLVQRSETFYEKNGLLAILLSRTVLSSIGPYIAYFCGIKRMKRVHFTAMALVGSMIWTTTYVMLGYTFAGNLPQISTLAISFMVTGAALLLTLGFAVKLILAWRRFETDEMEVR